MLCAVPLLCLATAVLGHQGGPGQEGRIVGGADIDTIDKYPHQLSLHVAGLHECGAIIISEMWALTAAQCAGGSVDDMQLRAGSASLTSGGTLHNVTQKIVHLGYNPATNDYDIALLEVDPPFNFTHEIHNVRPVVLPEQTDADPTDVIDLSVSGWGVTSPGGVGATTLQVAVVRAMEHLVCQNAYEPTVITDRMICAGSFADGVAHFCQGDFGGPLVVTITVPALLVGIVSWGRSCTLPGYPGVYTKASAFRDWILDNSGV